VRKQIVDSSLQEFQASWLEGFNFLKGADKVPEPETSPQPKPAPNLDSPLLAPDLLKYLNSDEQKYITSKEHDANFKAEYRFDRVFGTLPGRGGFFADTDELEKTSEKATWPTKFECTYVKWRSLECVGDVSLAYSQARLEQKYVISDPDKKKLDNISLTLAVDERICKVIIGTSDQGIKVSVGKTRNAVTGVVFLGVETTNGQFQSVGKTSRAKEYSVCTPPKGFTGLKGFWGERGVIVDRLGAIWGHEGTEVDRLGAIWGHEGTEVDRLGAIWGHEGTEIDRCYFGPRRDRS
jgi:hypothetical protein